MPPHTHPHPSLQPRMLHILIPLLPQPVQLILQTIILAGIANILLQLVNQFIVLNLFSQLFDNIIFDGDVDEEFLVLTECLETLFITRVLEVHGDALNLLETITDGVLEVDELLVLDGYLRDAVHDLGNYLSGYSYNTSSLLGLPSLGSFI